MNAQELLDEWESGASTGLRPARVQSLRDDIRRHTDLTVPRRLPEIEAWLPRMKGQITKKLREAAVEDEGTNESGGDE